MLQICKMYTSVFPILCQFLLNSLVQRQSFLTMCIKDLYILLASKSVFDEWLHL